MSKKRVKPSPIPPRQAKPERQVHAAAAETPDHFKWVAGSLAAIAFLLYVNTLGHQYVLDDPLAIGGNEYVKQGLGGIGKLLSHHYRAGTEGAGASALLYRPLSLVTFAIEWSLAPGNPFMGHFMNAVWYALTAGLAFAALRRLFRGYHWLWAAGTALLFATHPLHTEVVANIKSRDELLNVFFSIAALYGWARWLSTPISKWLTLALGCYFLALLSKESAVTLLPVFPLASWVFFNKNARESAGHALLMAIPVVLFLMIRAAVLAQTADNFVVSEMDNPIVAAQGFGERAATSFMVLWKYFQLLVFPSPLLSDYSYRHLTTVGWSDWQALAGLALYTGLAVFGIWGLLRRQALAFCALAFGCGIALYSQLFLVIGTLFGERLMYWPSLWFCAAAAFLLWRLSGFDLRSDADKVEWPAMPAIRIGALLLLAVAVLFGLKTIARNPDWKDNLRLFTTDSAKAPNSVRLHNGVASESYGKYLQAEKMPEPEKVALLQQVEQHSQTALAIRPNPVSYLNLGNVAISRRQFAEAIRQYEAALREAPKYGIARINLSRTYQAWGREEGRVHNNLAHAAELFEKAVEYGANDSDIYLDLGTAYGMMGQNAKAIPNFEKATQLNPQNKTAWKNLAIAYRSVGDIVRATACEQRAK